MKILGISAYYHDAAACLVVDGRVVAAAQEERFTRRRHDAAFPVNAINYCLMQHGCRPADIDHVVFYDKPFLKFERLLETYFAFAPRGFTAFMKSVPSWLKEKLFQKSLIARELGAALGRDVDWEARLLFSEHHLSHAASAFFPSPFQRAAVLTMDGVGEWATTSIGLGDGNQLEIRKEIHFPHSLGLLYSAFTYYTGFRVNSGEYKVMGLAPYGQPRYAGMIRDNLLDLREDGSFALDMSYFNYCTGLTMTSERFHSLFGGAPRKPEAALTQREMDLAASVQAVTEEAVLRLAKEAARSTGADHLCLAGGVALNCVANGRLLREKIFKGIWVQPAAGDAGGALGAALAVHHMMLDGERPHAPGRDGMSGAYLGPDYGQPDIERRLEAVCGRYEVMDEQALLRATATALAEGKAVGWHQGRMEFGPRALGNRSILADPRSPTAQKHLNLKIKFRESFRPFAPSVLREDLSEWFDLDDDSPYMLFVAEVSDKRRVPKAAEDVLMFGIERLNVPRSSIPAVTHVDYSARIQTVHPDTNPRYHALLRNFKELTGCPVLVNTSFNIRGEPIVATPEDAFHCFMGTNMDLLVVGNCLLRKEAQDPALMKTYLKDYGQD